MDDEYKQDWNTNLRVIGPTVLITFYVSYSQCDSLNHYLETFAKYFSFGFGLLWTLLEYIMHRFVLHKDVNLDPEEKWTEEGGERNAKYF